MIVRCWRTQRRCFWMINVLLASDACLKKINFLLAITSLAVNIPNSFIQLFDFTLQLLQKRIFIIFALGFIFLSHIIISKLLRFNWFSTTLSYFLHTFLIIWLLIIFSIIFFVLILDIFSTIFLWILHPIFLILNIIFLLSIFYNTAIAPFFK